MRGILLLVFPLLFGRSGHLHKSSKTNKSLDTLDCDVGIVGGGISGLYMAYEILKKNSDTKVCIFEKDNELGGRIRDHRFKEAPDIDVGLGAWRIDKKQPIMLELLKQLNITTKEWSFVKPDLRKSRGITTNNTEDIKEGYPAFKADPKFGNMTKSELWSYLLKPENVAQAKNYATFYTYVSNMITSEGANYLNDLNIHSSPFQESVSPKHFIEVEKVCLGLSGKYVRPHGGMSAIIDKLNDNVKVIGAQIYTSTEVQSISKKDSQYIIRTPDCRVRAKKLVVATPPGQFRNINGVIAKKIQRTPQFKSMLPIPAFKGAAVYKTPWWEKVKIGNTFIQPGQQFQSHDSCLGTSMAHRGYGTNGEGVMHTVYTDGACARRWKEIADLKTDYIDAEIHRALEEKYGLKISKPIDTTYQYWDSAWHFQKSDTPFALKDISNWARRPFPDEDIYLVGTSYDPMRVFCEGAVSSCRHALKEGWGIVNDCSGDKSADERYNNISKKSY